MALRLSFCDAYNDEGDEFRRARVDPVNEEMPMGKTKEDGGTFMPAGGLDGKPLHIGAARHGLYPW